MEGHGRAKTRGRARSISQNQPRPPQPGQPMRRPGGTGEPSQQRQPSAPVSGGRATTRGGVPLASGGGDSLASKMAGMKLQKEGHDTQIGRGSLRGRRTISDVVKTRPSTLECKQGKGGKSIMLQANYFRLITHADFCLYQYRIDFAPEEDNTLVKKKLLGVHREILGAKYLFDGSVMYNIQKLSPDPMELFSNRESDGANIRITIKLVGDLMYGDDHYIQVYNLISRKCLRLLRLQLVGRDYYDAHNKVEHPDLGLEIWPGYTTSIRQHDPNLLMCAEITHKIMRNETCYDILSAVMSSNPRDFQAAYSNAVIGSVVLTPYNNRTYKICDVDYKQSPASTFKKDNQDISYITYFKEKYNVNIKHKNQPMLVYKSKARELRAGQSEFIQLVPELCNLTGITEEMRSNMTLMRNIQDRTRVGPRERVERLLRLNRRLMNEPMIAAELNQWNMRLDTKLVEFTGRVIPAETIRLGNNMRVPTGDNVDWTTQLRSNPMLHMGELSNWVIMYPNQLERDVEMFVSQLIKVGKGMRFRIQEPQFYGLRDDRTSSYVHDLDNVISKMSPFFIICVVSNNNAERYGSIKKKCCVERAVPIQVVVRRNANGKNMSVTTKIAIQINAKIGGAPWSVPIPLTKIMVVGFDVCHDAKQKGKSFGAMVASIDADISRYFSCVTAHSQGEELSNFFAINIAKAIRKFQEVNNCLPDRIIIYRDGVGEGQLRFVYEHELEGIKKSLNELYGGEMPKCAFIVVTKRINTRIFCNGDNPPPGTVADDCITNPEKYDFFLVSQTVRQGTVSPTAYNVIHDTSGLDPDKIQRFTYKMTHLYYNWSGTIRVPAPCQYAHKLAFLASQSLHRDPNSGLETLLYFL